MKSHSMTRSTKLAYRDRLKRSKCRLKSRQCTLKRGCKKTRSGKRKSYCRKITNCRV